jgi:hypothetical protein
MSDGCMKGPTPYFVTAGSPSKNRCPLVEFRLVLHGGNGPLADPLKARCMDWIIFACVSIGAAAAGIGMVMAASRIEHRRRARHTEGDQ